MNCNLTFILVEIRALKDEQNFKDELNFGSKLFLLLRIILLTTSDQLSCDHQTSFTARWVCQTQETLRTTSSEREARERGSLVLW